MTCTLDFLYPGIIEVVPLKIETPNFQQQRHLPFASSPYLSFFVSISSMTRTINVTKVSVLRKCGIVTKVNITAVTRGCEERILAIVSTCPLGFAGEITAAVQELPLAMWEGDFSVNTRLA